MDLAYSTEERAFEAEVRAFLDARLPLDIAQRVLAREDISRDDMVRWHSILNDKGWLAGPWPEEFGGQAWGPVEAHIFEEECCRAGAPRIVPFGIKMLGPVLMKFGSPAQQAEYLPRILDGRDWWCQGYSEPGAGSDLASLKTRAERDGANGRVQARYVAAARQDADGPLAHGCPPVSRGDDDTERGSVHESRRIVAIAAS